jgi:Putative MetA-pathway of phenol degradation
VTGFRPLLRACWLLGALLGAGLVTACAAGAQDLEPRAYSNTPIGLNFLLTGYAYSHGDVTFDSSVPIDNAKLTLNTALLAYARSFDVFGRTGKLDVVLPYAWLSGTAEVQGEQVERNVSGLADPRVRFSLLLYGAPALPLAEYEDYKQDLIVGVSLAVTPPLGQYDSDKLVNIGTNRWSVRPELGISKTLGPFILELAPSVTFYTTNHDFFGGKTLERDPLFAVQGHLTYLTRFGFWASLDATYYTGARTTVDGEQSDSQENVRVGLTLAIPVNRYNSIKLYGSGGAMARIGGNFTTGGIVWQVRWGGGL